MSVLSRAEAKAVYDAFGAKQDAQAWYEDPAVERMLAHAGMGEARSVFEWGCGTGRLAKRLMEENALEYVGVELSDTMVALAREKLAAFGSRARVVKIDGEPQIEGSFDRVLSTYVLDLMSEEDIRALVVAARRALSPGGRLCLVGLTCGERGVARLVMKLWQGVHARWPKKVGGCRPLRMTEFLGDWEIRHRSVVTSYGIASEAVVAVPRGTG
jgi:SAM-dependent methyltransferase